MARQALHLVLLKTSLVSKLRETIFSLLVYILTGFLIVEIAYYAILCQPFSQYWAMPVKNPECTTYHNYSVIQMIFNISSDIFLFFLPTWIVLRSKMLPKQRLICLVPFSLALITIIFAILNKSVLSKLLHIEIN